MTTMQGKEAAPRVTAPLDLAYRVRRNVRAEMGRNGELQSDLAAVMGCAQQAVSNRLAGRTPFSLADIEALALHWGMRPSDLLEGRPAPDPLLDAASRLPTNPCLSDSPTTLEAWKLRDRPAKSAHAA